MNGDTPLPSTNKGIILVVVLTLAVNATIGLSALAYCLVWGIEPNQVLLTAFISIITGLLGLIGGMLSRTAPTEMTKQLVQHPLGGTIAPPPTNGNPTPVEVVNSPGSPVPTKEEAVEEVSEVSV